MFTLPSSSPLIFGIGSLNTKWGILYQHQYAPAAASGHWLGSLDHSHIKSQIASRFTFISERNIRGRIINDQIYILFMIYHRILGIKTGPKLMVVLEEL